MKKYLFGFLLMALAATVVFTSCDDDEMPANGTIEIVFRGNYDDQPLDVQAETYAYPDGSDLKVLLFQYYLSDLGLLRDQSATESLSEIELIRYNLAGAGNEVTKSFDVPAGNYSGLQFGLGVKPELNNQPPSNFAADYVLNEAEYWNDMVRYVFAKIEANVDLENDGTFDTPVSYHMGSNDVYTTITFNGNIEVNPNETTTLEVTADVLDALAGSDTEYHDFSDPDQRIVHGGNQAIAMDIWNRLVQQFRLSVR